MEKVIFELTKGQAVTLQTHLEALHGHIQGELEACEILAKETKEDGTLAYPNMPGNVEYWKEKEKKISELIEVVESAIIGG